MRPSTASAAATALAIALCVPGAMASAPALHWSAPAGCPDASGVKARIEAIVGSALAATIDADVVVHRAEESRYAAEVRVRLHGGDVGERSLEEATCDLVADAVATILTMALDPRAQHPVAPAPTSVSADRPSSLEAASRPSPSENVVASRPSQRRPAGSEPRFAAGPVAMVDDGTLPSPALGAGGALAWYPVAPLRVEVTVVRWLEQSATVEGQPFGGTFQLTSAHLRSCWSLVGRTVTIGPCAGVEAAHIDARGFHSTTVADGAATWWSPSAGALLHWTPLQAIGLAALGDVVLPVARPTFVIVSGGPIHQAAFASLRGQIVAEVRF
jgi:hypothetical protein